jgi:hypothetical protein
MPIFDDTLMPMTIFEDTLLRLLTEGAKASANADRSYGTTLSALGKSLAASDDDVAAALGSLEKQHVFADGYPKVTPAGEVVVVMR